MLKKIEISNFKNFDNKIIFDLGNTKSFEFNQNSIKNGIVKTALIYGHNGTGKSNMGFAIFDLISHLTDKHNGSFQYKNYLNAMSEEKYATFCFEFAFDDNKVVYEYTKTNLETLIKESFYINNEMYIEIDREKSYDLSINAKGAENLKKDLEGNNVSIIAYLQKYAVLDKNDEKNMVFYEFVKFINGMLFFRSLEQNNYIGYKQGTHLIGEDIIKHNNIKDFEAFLNEAGIECKLDKIENGGEYELAFVFGKNKIRFFDIASQGTKALALFYYWYQRIRQDENVSFVFIDEFDAFYHHELSALIVENMKQINAQTIMTTHNTSIITNSILRPDCYFLIKNNEIKSLSNRTQKELRNAHNIEKMYRAGSFG